MRIHLPLYPHQFQKNPSNSSSPPLIQLGGDIVLVELQGELTWEGDKSEGVVGVIGLDRPDKPTLHLGPHHLLHGKFANLQKPYAVIRRVVGDPEPDNETHERKGIAVEGSFNEEEESEDEDEEPLFPVSDRETAFVKDQGATPRSSSPFHPPSTPRDYSSDIEMSSPVLGRVGSLGFSKRGREEEIDEETREEEEQIGKRKKMEEIKQRQKRTVKKLNGEEKERTRHYAVVGIVRKKVVFALRPEPLVAPTMLPE
ncbi:hypothetical protein L204_102116 [Cryptococcus depauperatus]|nr:chromosome transmission fidelity protein 8 [Cryptococcus depauperatus CBS 7855]